MLHDPPPIPEQQPPKLGPEDDIYSYNCALLEDGLFLHPFIFCYYKQWKSIHQSVVKYKSLVAFWFNNIWMLALSEFN